MTSRFPTPAEFASFPEPNYVNPITRQPLVVGVMVPLSVLVIVFMFCRLYSRTILVNAIGWDDWIMMLAGTVAVANNILITLSTSSHYQMGYHIWDIRLTQLLGTLEAGKFGLSIQLLFLVSMGLTKVSILMTYLRIFPSKTNKWFCYIMLVYTIAFSLACFFLVLFQCTPVHVYWETFKYLATVKKRCRNVKVIYFFYNGQSTLSDFLIFLWPIKDIASVRISRRQRITLSAMFSCGVIVCVAGIARIYYTYVYLYSFDVLWWAAAVFVVMSFETCIGIACGCLPGCKPLMSRAFPRVFGTSTNDSKPPSRRRRAIKEIFSSGHSGATSGGYRSFELHSLKTGDEGVIISAPRTGHVNESILPADEYSKMPRRPSSVAYCSEDDRIWVPIQGNDEPKIYRDWQRS